MSNAPTRRNHRRRPFPNLTGTIIGSFTPADAVRIQAVAEQVKAGMVERGTWEEGVRKVRAAERAEQGRRAI